MGGPRRDVATLLPGDEMKVFMYWKDFLGKHLMRCHNAVYRNSKEKFDGHFRS